MALRQIAEPRGRLRIASWLLGVALVGAPLAIGAQHTVALVILAAVVGVACGLSHFAGPVRAPRLAARALIAVAVLLTLYTAVQIIPLPIGVVRALAPETADVWERALSPLREAGPSWVTLSLDPIATRVEVLRGLIYTATLLTALRIAHAREGTVFLERALVAAGLMMVGAALIHPALGAQRVFGAYKPGETFAYQPTHIAPLLNVNHLSGFVNVGFFVAFGAALAPRDASMPRVVSLAAAALLLATNIWAGSRGGTLALAVAFVATLAMARAARRAEKSRFLATFAVATMLMGGAALFALGFSDALTDLGSRDVSKLLLAKRAFGLVPKFPVFGTGRGAFQSVFPVLGFGRDNWVFTHPENVIAQWVTEWGLPVAVLAFALLAYALSPRAVLSRSHAPIGPWAALAAAGVHNMVDFNSEVPGVMMSLVVCGALVTAGSSATRNEPVPDGATRLVPKLALAMPVAVAAVALFALPAAPNELYPEQRRFQDLAIEPSMTKARFHELVKEAMLRHPADPYFAFTGALRAALARDESVLPWAGHALARNPIYGRAHLVIARAIFVQSPAQARLEYRLAYTQEVNLREPIAAEAPRLVGNFEAAMDLVPPGALGVPMLDTLAARLGQKLPATSWRLDSVALERDAAATGALTRRATAALSDLAGREPWCEGDRRRACLDEGLAHARRARAADPTQCAGGVLVAELLAVSGDGKGALDEIDRSLETAADHNPCVQAMVVIAERTGQRARADTAMVKLERMGCKSSVQCADNLAFLAETELSRKNVRHAVALYRRAYDQAPDREDFLITAAELAEQNDMNGEALDSYGKLAQRHPGDQKWTAAVARTRGAVQDRVFRRPIPTGDPADASAE